MGVKSIPTSQMNRNKLVKRMDGSIFEMIVNGKTVISRGNVVDQEAYDAYLEEQRKKQEAAKAATMQKIDNSAPDRTQAPANDKIKELEDKIKAQDDKLDAILEALKK